MAAKGKVLVLVSSGHGLPLKDGKVYTGAGYYLNELTVPVRALMQEGYEITFSNPKGNTPQLDVHSAVPDFFGGDAARLAGGVWPAAGESHDQLREDVRNVERHVARHAAGL